jgi:hypothetical protein
VDERAWSTFFHTIQPGTSPVSRLRRESQRRDLSVSFTRLS